MQPKLPVAVRIAVLLIFLLSGAAALVYEVVWTRRLVLVLGVSAQAVSTVLATFMAGLAIGAGVGGRLADRYRPLRFYAVLEASIAALGFASPFLIDLLPGLYVPLRRVLEPGPALVAARAVLAGLVLLPPTILMGATLPALAKAFAARGSRVGASVGILYSLNTLGAVGGTLAAAFYLIDATGLRGSLQIAAATNLVVALLTFAVAAVVERQAPAAEAAPTAGSVESTPRERRVARFVFAVSGFAALANEVLWHRYLIYSVGDNSAYAFAQMLATFLFGLALGGMLAALVLDRVSRPLAALGWIQVGIGIFTISSVFFFSSSGRGAAFEGEGVLRAVGGFWTTVWFGFRECLRVELLPTVLFGATFPVVARIVATRRETAAAEIGRASAWNTAGAIGGAALGGFVVLPLLGLEKGVVLTGALSTAAGILCLLSDGGGRVVARRLVAAGGVVAAASLSWAAAHAESRAARALVRDPARWELLAYHDGPSASIGVVKNKRNGRSTIFVDGDGQAGDGPKQLIILRFLGHLPLLHHLDPREVLVIGFGAGVTAGAIGTHPIDRLDVCELSRIVPEYAPFFSRGNHDVIHNPKLHLTIEDGRNYLLATERTFDVITSDPIDPDDAGVTSLYCKDFYELVASRLKPGGVAAQWMPGDYSEEMFRALIESFRQVFPECFLYDADYTYLVVGRKPGGGTAPWSRLERVFGDDPAYAGVRASLAEIGVDRPEDFLAMQHGGPRELEEYCRGAPVITDDRPLIEYRGPLGYARAEAGSSRPESATTSSQAPERVALLELSRRRADAILRMRNPDRSATVADWSEELEAGCRPAFEAIDSLMRLRRENLGGLPGEDKEAPGLRILEALRLPAPRIADILGGMDVPEFAPGEPTEEFGRVYDRALEAYGAGKVQRALGLFQELLRGRPGSPRASIGAALCWIALHDGPAAAAAAFRLLESGPRSDALVQNLVRPILQTLITTVASESRGAKALALLQAWTGEQVGASSEGWRRWWFENQAGLRFDLAERRFVPARGWRLDTLTIH